MFRWYQRANKCYVYLTDVSMPEEVADAEAFRISWEQAFRRSRWFTRGWTLQELLAPASVEFFSRDGQRLGSRISLEQEIHEITAIPIRALRGQKLTEFSIEERTSWAAGRATTLKEDKVYCLLGIFGVFLPLIYGEGEDYAALRLREEIQKRQQGRSKVGLQDLSSAFPLSKAASFCTGCVQLTIFSLLVDDRRASRGIPTTTNAFLYGCHPPPTEDSRYVLLSRDRQIMEGNTRKHRRLFLLSKWVRS